MYLIDSEVKTTLARTGYNNIKNQFNVSAQCSVSKLSRKKVTLLTILGDTIEIMDEIRKKDDEDLVLSLHQNLSSCKFIIVLDDVWDNQSVE